MASNPTESDLHPARLEDGLLLRKELEGVATCLQLGSTLTLGARALSFALNIIFEFVMMRIKIIFVSMSFKFHSSVTGALAVCG